MCQEKTELKVQEMGIFRMGTPCGGCWVYCPIPIYRDQNIPERLPRLIVQQAVYRRKNYDRLELYFTV